MGQVSTAISPVVGSMSRVIVPSSPLSGNEGAFRGDGDASGIGSSSYGCSIGDGDGNSTGEASSCGGSESFGPVPLIKYFTRFSVSPGAAGFPVFWLDSKSV